LTIMQDFRIMYLEGKDEKTIRKEVENSVFQENMRGYPHGDRPFSSENSFLINHIIGASLSIGLGQKPEISRLPSVYVVDRDALHTLHQSDDRFAARVMLFDKARGKDETWLSLAAWVPPQATGKAHRLVLTDDISMPPSFLDWSPQPNGSFDSSLIFGVDIPEQNNKSIKSAVSIEQASRSFGSLMRSRQDPPLSGR